MSSSNFDVYYIQDMVCIRQINTAQLNNLCSYNCFENKAVAINKLKLIENALDKHYIPKMKNEHIYYYIDSNLIINTFSYSVKLDGQSPYVNNLIIHKNCFKTYDKAKKYKEIIKNILESV